MAGGVVCDRQYYICPDGLQLPMTARELSELYLPKSRTTTRERLEQFAERAKFLQILSMTPRSYLHSLLEESHRRSRSRAAMTSVEPREHSI
jgi:hypothetical protein